MKKNKQYRAKKATIRNTKRAMKDKKRDYPRVLQQTPKGAKMVRAYKPYETVTVFEHGPSSCITRDSDGKLKFTKWVNKGVHQKDYTTEDSKRAAKEIHKASIEKKKFIDKVLAEVGYDSTINYTRKQKKRFTRAVKKAWSKTLSREPAKLTTEQVKAKISTHKERKQQKRDKYANLPYYKDAVITPPNVKGKQRPLSASELVDIRDNEKPNKRKFCYTVDRVVEADIEARAKGATFKTYAFLTSYFEEETVKKAEKKLSSIAKKYMKDDTFTGITLKDPDGENITTYYTMDKLKQLAA